MTVIVQGLQISATKLNLPIVDDVSFTVPKGEVLGLVGESGSGKTSIAHAMLGFSRKGTAITGGSINIDGTEILNVPDGERRSFRGRLVSYVPQDPNASLNPALTIGKQLIERLIHGPGALPKADARARLQKILEDVRLPSDAAFLSSYPSQISGGQQQRVGIAMAIASHPRLIVLDEPTTGLDVATQNSVLELVARICREHHISAIYISHDLAVVKQVSDKVLVLYAGKTMEGAAAREFFRAPRHPYSNGLLASIPSIDEGHLLRSIEGIPPALEERGNGCLFKDRCTYTQPVCDTEPATKSAEHFVRCHFPIHDDMEALAHEARPIRNFAAECPVALDVSGLSASYGAKIVLRETNFTVRAGESVAIVGESGSGKSTLSRCLIGLHENWTGKVVLDGEELPRSCADRSLATQKKMQFIFQNPYGSLNPRRTVRSCLELSVRQFEGDLPGEAVVAKVATALEKVNLSTSYLDRFPGELSGGEKQRVAIARALLPNPKVLICDEVTSALDISVQATIVELLRGLMNEGLGVVFVTHNLAVVRSLSDRVAVLNQGEIVEAGPVEQVIGAPKDPYSKFLLESSLSL